MNDFKDTFNDIQATYIFFGKKFEEWTLNNGNFSYQEWFYLRSQDGALCRDDTDCNWIE